MTNNLVLRHKAVSAAIVGPRVSRHLDASFEALGFADFPHCFLRECSSLFTSIGDYVSYQCGVIQIFLSPLLHWDLLVQHPVNDRLFAFKAANVGSVMSFAP